jgi:predicted DNA-binding transcriptional regulator AlpA
VRVVTNNIAMPTMEDLKRAIRWEEGEIPDWVKIT